VAVAVHAPVDKEWVAIAQIAGLAVASLVSLRFATDAFEWRASPSFANLKRITKEALPLGAALLAAQIYYNLDVILLRLWRSEAETGLYASAYRIALLIIGLRHLLVQGLFPQLVRSAHAGAEEARTIVLAAQRVGTSFGFPLVVGGILWATPVLRLVFGEGFRGAGSTFAVLLAMTGVVFIDLAWPQLLNAYDRSGTYFWVILSGAIVNLALNIVLIPRVGMMGAAIATFAAELAVMLAAVWSVRSTVRVPFFSYASRPLMASIGMAVAGYVTMPAGLIWSIGSAVAVYLLLLVVSRAVTFNDFIVLERGTA
jgi:O-antigen/teichoic acid export membrane protein